VWGGEEVGGGGGGGCGLWTVEVYNWVEVEGRGGVARLAEPGNLD
jgi:hypothetical protein